MNKLQMKIPPGVFYLGTYSQILNQLPSGQFILNKVMTGCGATTLFLEDNVPTVLCSPRKELIHCKAYSDRFVGKVHLFGDKPGDAVIDKINAMKGYVSSLQPNPFFTSHAPKILTTYDSAKHVIQGLQEMGLLDQFRFVVDEFQTLFTDAAFRGDTEAEFMENIRTLPSVIFLSATPYIETYLDMLDEFQNLPYVELKWPESSIHPTSVIPEPYYNGSPPKTIERIINKFRTNGYFEVVMDSNGKPVLATEAVFFVNDVKFIVNTIRKNGLKAGEVNILCSERPENRKTLKQYGLAIGHAPKEEEKHPTYTFCTKASFEGTDFYSPCAYTYIFGDINREHLAIDISLDLPQIMGRQRLSSNAFRYSATMFYKTKPDFSDNQKQQYMDNIRRKDEDTKAWLNDCSGMPHDQLLRNAKVLSSAQKEDRYTKNYVSVIDDKTTNQPKVVYNRFVMLNELRSWDVQMNQYQGITYVMGNISSAFAGNSTAIHESVMQFLSGFCGPFEQRMKMYSEFYDQNPECREELLASVSIPISMKTYHQTLGTDKLRSLSWKESKIL